MLTLFLSAHFFFFFFFFFGGGGGGCYIQVILCRKHIAEIILNFVSCHICIDCVKGNNYDFITGLCEVIYRSPVTVDCPQKRPVMARFEVSYNIKLGNLMNNLMCYHLFETSLNVQGTWPWCKISGVRFVSFGSADSIRLKYFVVL